jgi:hypothetical protein
MTTRILFFYDLPKPGYLWLEDERPARELMMLVNTRQVRIGQGRVLLDHRPQYAMALHEFSMISVSLTPPPFALTQPLYSLLWALAGGQTAEEMASEFALSPHYVQERLGDLRLAMESVSNEEVLAKAKEYCLL